MMGSRIVGPMTRIPHKNRASRVGPRTCDRATFYPLVIDLTGNSVSGSICCLYYTERHKSWHGRPARDHGRDGRATKGRAVT
jgi:hypothetical protein